MASLANYPNWDKTEQELERIGGSVATMRQAIIDHGVDVPEDVKLADLPEYILEIPHKDYHDKSDGTAWGTLYTTQYPDGLVLNNQTSYNNLCEGRAVSSYPNITVNGLTIPKSTIRGFTFGDNCTYINADFLTYCYYLDMPMVIPSYVSSGLNGTIMGYVNNYTGPITIYSTVVPSGNQSYSLAANSSTAAAYTQGIVLRGPGASIWRSKMPDESSTSTSQYRKLIIEE